MEKHNCDCGKTAVYLYMPSNSKDKNPYFCEDCVPRGCSCNWEHMENEDAIQPPTDGTKWKWIVIENKEGWENVKEGEMWTALDEEGREFPCCEFMYDEKGFEIYTKEETIEINKIIDELIELKLQLEKESEEDIRCYITERIYILEKKISALKNEKKNPAI